MHYPFDLQIFSGENIQTVAAASAYVENANTATKIRLLTYMLHHKENFKYAALRQFFKKYYPISFFTNMLYNSLLTNYYSEGKSGVLYLLLQLDDFLADDVFAESIEKFMKTLVFELNFTPLLCYHDDQQQNSPVGFYKGNSGIAYIFLVLASYFKNNEIAVLSQGLLAYEDTKLLQDVYHTYQVPLQSAEALQECKENYLQKNDAYFDHREQAITPLEAFLLFKVRVLLFARYNIVPNKAVLKKLQAMIASDETLSEIQLWSAKVIDALENHTKLPEGEHLKLPIEVTSQTTNDFSYKSFVLQHVSITFRRTLAIFTHLETDLITAFENSFSILENPQADFHKLFYEFCLQKIPEHDEKYRACVTEILAFEYDSVLQQREISNHLKLYINDIITVERREQILTADDASFSKFILRANPLGKLVKSSWNWTSEEIFERLYKVEVNLEANPHEFYCFKLPLGVFNLEKKSNIKEIILSEYEYILVDLFEFPVTVVEVIKEFSTIFEVENEEDYQKVYDFTKEIIKTLIFKKCLIL